MSNSAPQVNLFGAATASDAAGLRIVERFEGLRAMFSPKGLSGQAASSVGGMAGIAAIALHEKAELTELKRMRRRTSVGGPGKNGREPAFGAVKSLRSFGAGRYGGNSRVTPTGLRASLLAQAAGAQAAVVKISGFGAGAKAARSMLDYNSRKSELPLETERGEVLTTREQRNQMLSEWEPFYDNRKPSDDVAALTLRWAESAGPIESHCIEAALFEVLKGHRAAIGVRTGPEGGQEAVVVFSLGRHEGRRRNWSEGSRAELAREICDHIRHMTGMPRPDVSFGLAGHGPGAVVSQIEAVLPHFGKLTLENGLTLGITGEGIEAKDVPRLWKRDLRSYETRDVMHLILSAKAGTIKAPFLGAVRGLLGEEFRNHRYAFVLHGPDDVKAEKRTQHIHVHAVILMRGKDGRKLDPRIEDLRRWRETMATHARIQGIAMTATRRLHNVNAPSYALGQLHAVRKGQTSARTAVRVAARQAGRAVAPMRPEGVLAAAAARLELQDLMRAGSSGAEKMLARHAEAIGAASRQSETAGSAPDVAAMIAIFAKVASMLSHDEERIFAMPDRATFLRQVREFDGSVARASEALRGDPALKARFDAETKPLREAIDGQIKRAEIDRAFETAQQARSAEAQARENAEVIRREALSRGDLTAADRKEENRFRSLAREAADEARQAEQQLKALGVSGAEEMVRKAALTAVADDDRKAALDLTRPNERGTRRRS